MKFRYLISLCISLLFVYSCDDSSSTSYNIDPSEDAQIYSFKIEGVHKKEGDSISRAEDSLRFLVFNKANFAINQVNSSVYNPDSLPYGLNLDMVKLTLTTNTTYGVNKIQIQTPDSLYDWNSTDSVDFSKMPVKIIIHAPKGNIKEYAININIHEIDPDLFVWNDMGVISQSEGLQKVILKDNDFYSYAVVSNTVKLFKSNKDILNWGEHNVTILPPSVILSSITYFNDKFMAITSDGKSYTSDNGIDWEFQNNGKSVSAIYGVIPGNTANDDVLVLLLDNAGKYTLGTTRDMITVDEPSVAGLGDNDQIPVSDFASATNFDRSLKYKYLVLTGGLTKDSGKELNSTILVEKTSSGLSLSRSVKNSLFKGKGLSMFFYSQNSLYVIANNELYISASWGEKWQVAPKKQIVDTDIAERTEQSVIVENGNIWLFGGKDVNTNEYLNDIWKGRLNGFK